MLNVQDSTYIKGAVKPIDYVEHDGFEIVFLGRSNVGKSTFINKFCKRKKLAYTSSKPGKTQVLNFFNINEDLYFVDVPGYGYAKVSKKEREKFGQMIEEYLTTRENLLFAVLLVDFKVGPTEDDLLMYEFLKYQEISTLIICTKKDKIKKSGRSKQEKAIINKLKLGRFDDLLVYSSEDDNDMINIHNMFETILMENNERNI